MIEKRPKKERKARKVLKESSQDSFGGTRVRELTLTHKSKI